MCVIILFFNSPGSAPEEYVLPILIFCGVGSFFFWLIFWIFGIKEIFGISTMIIGAAVSYTHLINPDFGTPELRTHYDNSKRMVKEKTGRAMQEKERDCLLYTSRGV